MAIAYRQSPSSATTQYQVDTTGDSYTLVTGDPNQSSENIGIATVVNYSVAANIQNNSALWAGVSPSFFDEKKNTIINALGDNTSMMENKEVLYYQINEFSYAAVVGVSGDIIIPIPVPGPGLDLGGGGMPIAISEGVFVEQITVNPNTLEYAVLRNNNPTFVNTFANFLRFNANPIKKDAAQTYSGLRATALSEVLGGGGFGNANRFFIVRNLVARRGSQARGITGGRFGDYGNFELYEKTGSQNGYPGVGPLQFNRSQPGNCGVWLTNVYVDTTAGTPVFYFPNGGIQTRGAQFYRNIVTSYLQSAETDG